MLEHPLVAGRRAWLQLIRGGLRLNGTELATGDGAAVSGEAALEIAATSATEFLLFDMK